MPIEVPPDQFAAYGLPQQLEAGVINLLNSLVPGIEDVPALVSTSDPRLTAVSTSAATYGDGGASSNHDCVALISDPSGREANLSGISALNIVVSAEVIVLAGVTYHRNIHRSTFGGSRIVAVSALGLGDSGVVNGY